MALPAAGRERAMGTVDGQENGCGQVVSGEAGRGRWGAAVQGSIFGFRYFYRRVPIQKFQYDISNKI